MTSAWALKTLARASAPVPGPPPGTSSSASSISPGSRASVPSTLTAKSSAVTVAAAGVPIGAVVAASTTRAACFSEADTAEYPVVAFSCW